MVQKYDHSAIEKKWQEIWEKNKINQVDLKNSQKKFYNLMMFPYPSAEGLHVGNMYAFTASDIYGRFKRLQGYNVFEPIGLDGFGIHSENYALKVGRHPKEHAALTEKHFYEQLHQIGNMYDWSKTVETYNPNYYKWTQWLFLQMYKKGLAYRGKSLVNFCPKCKTVLSDEQVIDGACERCSTIVEKKEMEQWFFKITAYADRLLENLEKLDWTEKVKIAQKNWIGKKPGINVTYEVDGVSESVEVFTTAPVNFGMTFLVLAPEHRLISKIVTGEISVPDDCKKQVAKYVEITKKKTDQERISDGQEKTGAFTGLYVINRINNKKVPVYVSDFVLAHVGTGAVQGCPGHDVRDFQFAKKFGLPIVRVIVGNDGFDGPIESEDRVIEHGMEGSFVNSEFLNGLSFEEGLQKTMDYFEQKGWGKRVATYHLRDWLVSRQRYWGPPIPMINCPKCGWVPVPEKDLPVLLPDIADYQPEGNGKGPLAKHEEFYKTKCPTCGGEAVRETDVSDAFVDSSWYELRYPSTEQTEAPFNPETTKGWLPVDMYTGGAEHSVLHLMYSRFVAMVLHDLGYLSFDEPFTRFFAHGLLLKDGAKISKSKGNVVNPDEYIAKYGADSVRTYLMFMGPVSQGGDFRDSGMAGMRRWIERFFRVISQQISDPSASEDPEVSAALNGLINKGESDLEARKYNLVIAKTMEFLNLVTEKSKKMTKEQVKSLLIVFSSFAPHLCEELWEMAVGANQSSVHVQMWPKAGVEIASENATIAVMVNGKLRATVNQESRIMNQEEIEKLAREKISKWLENQTVKKVIFVPGKVINFVVF